MPQRDDDLLIRDMVDCCKKIMNYVEGMNYENFIDGDKTVDAVIKKF